MTDISNIPSLVDLIANQNKIYGFFEKDTENITKLGTEVSKVVKEGEKAYIIGYTHSYNISDAVEKISDEINDIIPVMNYGTHRGNVHTTLCVVGADSNLNVKKEVINKLKSGLESKIDSLSQPQIHYKAIYSNKNDVIAIGDYGEAESENAKKYYSTYSAAQEVANDVAKEFDLSVKPAKMAHITVTRYLSDIHAGDKKLEELKSKLDLAQFDIISKPQLFVATYTLKNGEFVFDNVEIIKYKH